MKSTIISLAFLFLFLSCGTERTASEEMKKGEKGEDTGLFVITESKGYCFFGVNKLRTKIERDYSFSINDKVIFSLERISEPVSNLRAITLLEDNEELRYVWVKLSFHAGEDMKRQYFKESHSEFHRYSTSDLTGDIDVDSVQVLDKAKEKIYQQTMDSLNHAQTPDILYGP